MLFSKTKKDDQMFRKLASNNVKMNAKNYMIYFLTLMFSVAMLYTFNSIGSQFKMLNLPDEGSYLSFSMGMIAAVSVFICLIMGFLVTYANRFLMRRRKKELGIYITLGISQKELTKLLYRETLIIGALSLGAGLVLGIILSQGLALITIRFLQIQGATYQFVLSPIVMIECVVFYMMMYAFINLWNKREIKKSTLLELLHAEQKNENVETKDVFKNVVVIVLAIVCFAVAYIVSAQDGFNMKFIVAGVILIFIGTFLFFRAIANIILDWTHRRKRVYYKDLNMFAVHQLSSKMNSTNITLSVICILLFLSFTTLSVGLGVSMDVAAGLDKMTSADVVITSYLQGNTEDKTIVQQLAEEKISLQELTENAVEINLFQQKNVKLRDFLSENMSGMKKIRNNEYLGWDEPLSMMKVSDYNKIRVQQGLKPIILSENEFALNYNVFQLEKMYENYEGQKQSGIEVAGTALSLKKNGIYTIAYCNANMLTDKGTLIVPDHMVEGSAIETRILNCNLDPQQPENEEQFREAFFNLRNNSLNLDMKSVIVTEITSTNMTLSYISVYIGIIFLICACAVLALQQMADTADSSKRYETLRRLGANRRHIIKSLMVQISIYFGVPLVLALVHASVIIHVMYQRMVNVTAGQIIQNILFATVLFLAIYGSYFFITYLNSKNVCAGESD